MILICLAVIIITVIINAKIYSRGMSSVDIAACIMVYVVFGISLLAAIITTSTALHDYGTLAAYEEVRLDYSAAIQKNIAAVVKADGLSGLFANKEHSTNISRTIEDWRHYEVWAKQTRGQWRTWNNHYLYRIFVPNPPKGLLNP